MVLQTSHKSSSYNCIRQGVEDEVVELLSNQFTKFHIRKSYSSSNKYNEEGMGIQYNKRRTSKGDKYQISALRATHGGMHSNKSRLYKCNNNLGNIRNDRYIPLRTKIDMDMLNSIVYSSMREKKQKQNQDSNDGSMRVTINSNNQSQKDNENYTLSCNQKVISPKVEYNKTLFGAMNSMPPNELKIDSESGTLQPERFFHFGSPSCRKEEEQQQRNYENPNVRNRTLPSSIRNALSETDIQGKYRTNTISKIESKKKAKKYSWTHNDTFVVTLPVVCNPLMTNVYDLSLGRDGSYLSISGGSRILYDYSNPKLGGNSSYTKLHNSDDWITCMEYCNQVGQEEFMCFGTMQGDVQLIQQWEEGDEDPIWNCRNAHVGRVTSLLLPRQSKTSGLLLSAGQDGIILCHNYLNGEILGRLVGHRAEITSMSLNADESLLASCDSMGQILIWDMISIFNMEDQTSTDHYHHYHTCCFYPRQALFYESSTHSVIWDPFNAAILMSGSSRGILNMWDIESGTIMRSIDTESSILSMEWSRTSNELITANNCMDSNIGTINIWNPDTLDKKLECDYEGMTIYSLSLSDDGTTLGGIFARGNQGYISTWNISGDEADADSRPRARRYKQKLLEKSPMIPINYKVPGALVVR